MQRILQPVIQKAIADVRAEYPPRIAALKVKLDQDEKAAEIASDARLDKIRSDAHSSSWTEYNSLKQEENRRVAAERSKVNPTPQAQERVAIESMIRMQELWQQYEDKLKQADTRMHAARQAASWREDFKPRRDELAKLEQVFAQQVDDLNWCLGQLGGMPERASA
jgi:phage-related minor tail protein